jgi:hypothetical protein
LKQDAVDLLSFFLLRAMPEFHYQGNKITEFERSHTKHENVLQDLKDPLQHLEEINTQGSLH